MILPLGRPGPNYRDIVPPQNTGPACSRFGPNASPNCCKSSRESWLADEGAPWAPDHSLWAITIAMSPPFTEGEA
ncbi:hypothetical protein VTN96DRAFT_4980 [Rasamsonia emersonii]